MTDVVLECRNLSKEYAVGPQRLRVLDQVHFSLHRGERIAIVGMQILALFTNSIICWPSSALWKTCVCPC